MGNKVVHFGTVHRPFDIRVFHRECKTLAEAGYLVTFVAPHERDEIVEGVRLTAIPVPKDRIQRVFRTMRQVYVRALEAEGDVYHFHDPELIPAALLLKCRGKRVIYDAHEDTPQAVLVKTYLPKWTRHACSRMVQLIEMIGAWAFDAVIAATPAIASRFPQHKTVLVQNFPIIEHCAANETVPYHDRPNSVVYSGVASSARGIKELVQALEVLPAELAVKLVLVGRFEPPDLRSQMEQLPGWKSVEYLGWRTRAEVLQQYSLARAGIVLFHPGPNQSESQPAKLYEYMEAGLPVIASDLPHWRQFVSDAHCGILVDPTDPRAVANAVIRILGEPEEAEAMGRRGQQAIREKFNWGREAQGMLELYEKLTT